MSPFSPPPRFLRPLAQKSNHREKKPITVPTTTAVMSVTKLASQIIAIAAPQVIPAKIRSQGENRRRLGFWSSITITPKPKPAIAHDMTNFGDVRTSHPPSVTIRLGIAPNKKSPAADPSIVAMLPQVVVINQSRMLELPKVVPVFEGILGIAWRRHRNWRRFSGFQNPTLARSSYLVKYFSYPNRKRSLPYPLAEGLVEFPTTRVQHGPYNSFYLSYREWPGCPLLRASSEHRFIVGALRARRAPGRSLLSLDCPFRRLL